MILKRPWWGDLLLNITLNYTDHEYHPGPACLGQWETCWPHLLLLYLGQATHGYNVMQNLLNCSNYIKIFSYYQSHGSCTGSTYQSLCVGAAEHHYTVKRKPHTLLSCLSNDVWLNMTGSTRLWHVWKIRVITKSSIPAAADSALKLCNHLQYQLMILQQCGPLSQVNLTLQRQGGTCYSADVTDTHQFNLGLKVHLGVIMAQFNGALLMASEQTLLMRVK